MNAMEQKTVAKKFAADWSGKGYEKGETARFWIDLLDRVFGVPNAANYIEFEKQIKLENGNQGYIDGYIPSVKVLIEQKGSHVDLRKPERQSDGTMQTPYQQARRYENEILKDEQPDWIILCNFNEFIVYDMRVDKKSPVLEFTLDRLPKEYPNLEFLVDKNVRKVINEVDISIAAGKLVSELYDALLEQYDDPKSSDNLRSLNILCVRLVFCFYAEDAGVFKGSNTFGKYLDKFRNDLPTMRRTLIELFKHLDTPESEWDKYDTELNQFPYVNGGLFDKNLNITIPPFNEKISEIIIDKASYGFDWAGISPTIFGAVFESTLNPETRRSSGMHYTSIENIHKVIDPLFLDDLTTELEEIRAAKQVNVRKTKLEAFREKLASLKFLDPACGSGNFLTETYLSLRRLENEALKIIYGDQTQLDTGDVIKVSIGQFYGIEINDFAVTVAKTALWITESQMMNETMEIVNTNLEFLPLKSYTNITEDNALTLDWEQCAPRDELDYIMGNPPFVGARLMSAEQKNDVLKIFSDVKNNGNLDYVCCWYRKTAEFVRGTEIRAALVSTNSITQGEQVAILWKKLFSEGIHIDYAYRTFRWDNETYDKAHVHCVIVGFSAFPNDKVKVIFDGENAITAKNINGYLVDADNICIESRNKPLCDVPPMSLGNQPIDGGHYSFTEEEKNEFVKLEPSSEKYFRKWVGSKEFINNITRYFLYLRECSPAELRKMPECCKRIEAVQQSRQNSTRAVTRQLAKTPREFAFTNISDGTYIVVPEVSSERRAYIPIGFLSPDILCSNLVKMIPNTTLYHFGVLTSSVHMDWVRTVCGRLKSDYRYSNTIVYNNFPWCEPTPEQKSAIEQTAQAILDARALYPDCSLADLYDETVMPKELRKAHENNDKAVLKAYGFSAKMSEQEVVAELMKMYESLDKR